MSDHKYKYNASPDPYCYEGSKVLKDKFGLTDALELEEAERKHTANRMGILLLQPISGRFGFAHLKSIHKVVFSDVYGGRKAKDTRVY